MSKTKKRPLAKVLAVVFALVLALTSAISASAYVYGGPEWEVNGNYTTLKDIVDMYWWSYQGYNKGAKGPFSISKAVLNKDGTQTNVYFVACAGFENIGNGNDKNATYLSAFNLDNGYTERVKDVMLKNVPKDSNIFFLGDSLGGYIVQQLAADSDIKYNYNVIQTTTIGAPEIATGKKEGNVARIMDKNDIVPNYMSLETYTDPIHRKDHAVVVDGGYGFPTALAHASYTSKETLGSYDVCGRKDGGATLVIDTTTTKFYRVPYNSDYSFIPQDYEINSGKQDDPDNVAVSYGE